MINISIATLNVRITNSTKINSYERLNQLIHQTLEIVTRHDLTHKKEKIHIYLRTFLGKQLWRFGKEDIHLWRQARRGMGWMDINTS